MGESVGFEEGIFVGESVGEFVGEFVGSATGEATGDATGDATGEATGEESSSGLFRNSPSFLQWASQHLSHVSPPVISQASQFALGSQ